jgi:hypothetical protein
MILSQQNEWEWRKVKFGMLPPYAKEITLNTQLIMPELKRLNKNVPLSMRGHNDQFALYLLKLFMNLNISMEKHIGMAYSVKMESHLHLQQFMKKP